MVRRVAIHETSSALLNGQSMEVGCYQLDHGKEGIKSRYTVESYNPLPPVPFVVDTGGAVTQVSEDATASDPRYRKSVIKRQGEILQGAGDIPRVGGTLIPARGFGDSHKAGISARPKITEKEINIGDIVIIASDGVWDWLPPDVVAEAVQSFREKTTQLNKWPKGL